MNMIGGAFLCGIGRDLPFLTPEDIAAGNQWCCYGDSEDGPTGCTCWDPVFDLEQSDAQPDAERKTRRTRCVDCAYRPDSPERAEGVDMDAMPNFTCHQGIRRPIAFRHPDGRVRPWVNDADYQPPMVKGVPFKADGSPADICAGWAQVQRRKAVAR